MSDAAVKRMTPDEFLLWREGREGTWELVDGQPRSKFYNGLQMMAGGTRNHAQVAMNLGAALRPRLRSCGCRPVGSDLAIRNVRGSIRQPDLSVYCGPGSGRDLAEDAPVALFEVLSPTTRGTDLIRKSEEYRQLPSVRHVVFLEADSPRLTLSTRTDDGWDIQEVVGLDVDLALSLLGVRVPMAEIYEDVDFAPLYDPDFPIG